MTSSPSRPRDRRDSFGKPQDVGRDVQRRMGEPVRRLPRAAAWKSSRTRIRRDLFHPVSCGCWMPGCAACKDYANRSDRSGLACDSRRPIVRTLKWLPPSCGYQAGGRRAAISIGGIRLFRAIPNTVHEAGVSVRGRVQGTENEIADADLEDHIVEWPGLLPKAGPAEKAAAILNAARINRSRDCDGYLRGTHPCAQPAAAAWICRLHRGH